MSRSPRELLGFKVLRMLQLPTAAVLTKVTNSFKIQAKDRVVTLQGSLGPKELALLEVDEKIYYFRPTSPSAVGLARNISVREEPDGKFTMKALAKDSVLPGPPPALPPGAPGSSLLHVLINPAVGHTTLAGLRFQDTATVNIQPDGSVQVERPGVRATDLQGNRFVSESLPLPDGKREIVLVKARLP